MKPSIDQIDQAALRQALEDAYAALSPEDRERLASLADVQGGFPFDWRWDADGLSVRWADVEIAYVPYALIRQQPSRAN